MQGTAGTHGPSAIVFLAQIVALLVTGRLMGEFMQRIGQPAVMGQLIGGILLGPSVLGLLWPGLQHALFPAAAEQKAMIDGIAQLGILMLLLLTGMETDLSVFRRSRGTAAAVSVAGIAVPFACGIGLGLLLPDALLPDPGKRLITTLFLATALSISSVKVVATVVREVGFLRRTLGQVIVAAAVIDDAIGWIIVSLTLGLALKGRLDPVALAGGVLGTAIFLAVSFTVGRRLVFWLIRWANDTFVSEMPVITTILVITGIMALITSLIGVHAVLGAFVAGILVGQSPILTRHIDHQLRGLIVALFMPLFFGLAGLSTNLALLGASRLRCRASHCQPSRPRRASDGGARGNVHQPTPWKWPEHTGAPGAGGCDPGEVSAVRARYRPSRPRTPQVELALESAQSPLTESARAGPPMHRTRSDRLAGC